MSRNAMFEAAYVSFPLQDVLKRGNLPQMVLPRHTRADRLNMMKGRLDSRDIRTVLSEYEQQVSLGSPDVPSLAAK